MIRFLLVSAAVSSALLCAGPASAASPPAENTSTAASASPAAPTAQADPTAQVQRLHDALLDVMKNARALGFEGRRAKLDPLIRSVFNFPAMTQAAVGPYWDQLPEADRKKVIEAFSQYSVATYAKRFDGYDGQSFETVGQEPGPKSAVWIKTKLIIPPSSSDPNGDTVNLNYLLRDAGDHSWRIVDVFLAGTVSELATRRSEYTSVIRRQGIAGLLQILETKTKELSQEKKAG